MNSSVDGWLYLGSDPLGEVGNSVVHTHFPYIKHILFGLKLKRSSTDTCRQWSN
jgi:hypothetical protein